jgi:deoxyribodipyrimidine photo-lyase
VPSILWFRRDLRLADHPALLVALRAGQTAPVFVLDPALWGPAGTRRRSYLAASLRHLDAAIRAIGGPGLAVHVGDPADVVPQLAQRESAEVFVTGDGGPYGARRDRTVAQRCTLHRVASPFLHDPGTIGKADGSAYRVFTPYFKAWRALPARPPLPAPQTWPAATGADARGDGWAVLEAVDDPPFPVGEAAAALRWQSFAEQGLAEYADTRNRPSEHGTSGLSAALKFGEIHPRTVVAEARGRPGGDAFVRQLCWREFYGHLLAAAPQTARENVQTAFDGFAWDVGPDADQAFAAWREGRTGYPFVDAGMRELRDAGTMPNRLRMVAASFLVKDLHQDWRRGARHFMQQLYDGDLANNQHGWQWTAGTGTDAAPYYRIFNPVTQGLRFDPDGDYVRRWVPELRGLPGAAVHEPWRHPRGAWPEYPERIVDHAVERDEAMRRYDAVRVRPAD